MKKEKKELITYRDIIVLTVGIVLATLTIFGVLWFRDNYRIQSLIVPRDISPVPSKTHIIINPIGTK